MEKYLLMPTTIADTEAKRLLFFSLQGLLADNKKLLFEGSGHDYVRHIKKSDKDKIKKIEKFFDVFHLLKIKFNGYILIDLANGRKFLNAATTVAGVERLLLCDISLEKDLKSFGIVKKYDFSVIAPADEDVFKIYKNKLSQELLIHQNPEKIFLRDYAIAKKAYCFYTAGDEKGQKLLEYVLSNMPENIPILGWTEDEISFVATASRYGKYIIPADWAENLSVLSDTKHNRCKQKYSEQNIVLDKNKHYIAFVVSDGDNIQWLLRDFSTDCLFGQRIKKAKPYKMTWTISPSLFKYAPTAMQNIYDKATPKDSFIASVSGAGYINPLCYPNKMLKTFTKTTAELMQKADLKYITLLDDARNIEKSNIKEKLGFYSQCNQIRGAIWELDPDRYEYGKGISFKVENKPFVSVKVSLWHLSNDMNAVTDEWIKEQAYKINGLEKNPYSITGYSIVNIHPWTMKMDYIDKFVSYLSPDIEIVSAGEIIEMINKNVNDFKDEKGELL